MPGYWMVTCWKDKCRMNSIQLACMAEPLSMSLLSDSFTMFAVQCVLMEIFDDLPSPCFIDIVMFFLYLCEMVYWCALILNMRCHTLLGSLYHMSSAFNAKPSLMHSCDFACFIGKYFMKWTNQMITIANLSALCRCWGIVEQ